MYRGSLKKHLNQYYKVDKAIPEFYLFYGNDRGLVVFGLDMFYDKSRKEIFVFDVVLV